MFEQFLGVLNSHGRGKAQLKTPADTGFVGTVLHFAYLLNKPFDYVSNPAPVEIVP
jgi:hypothetical protein